jgi:hypothetical protein
MRNMKWLLAAGLIAATTAACTTDSGYYPSTSYNSGYSSNGYYYPSSSYNRSYSSSGYYPSSAYSSGYYTANRAPRRGPNGDYDRDGIPNRYDRDANGDGVPDRYQR